MSNSYWEDRQASAQAVLTKKNIKETEEQLKKYYNDAMRRMSGGFLSTYNKILRTVENPTPAHLYKLNTYWQLQAQVAEELRKLGDKQAVLYRKQFVKQWTDIYESIALKDDVNFSTLSYETVSQMISAIWCNDGKSWADRIWINTNRLQQTLNDELIHCVLTGASPRYLKEMLMYEFNVSYNNADTLVRTEMAHIQTQASRQRYLDGGVKELQIWADYDERQCPECGKLHKKIIPATEQSLLPPFHPRCRCCVIPVIK